jgi:hypothetical protein
MQNIKMSRHELLNKMTRNQVGFKRHLVKKYGNNTPKYRKVVHEMSRDVLKLCVFGTMDELAKSINWSTSVSKKTCKCCGQKSKKLILSSKGKVKLKRFKRCDTVI